VVECSFIRGIPFSCRIARSADLERAFRLSRRIKVVLPKITVEVKRMEQEGLEKLAGQAIRLIDLADYQEGSVVSRTIIDKKTGTVTFFAFDGGQGLSEHTTPFDALVHLLDGEAEIIISGKHMRLKNGEMVIMPANQPHALRAIKSFKMILTMIRS
jgi:quercetin dioxygenase-like cupin family protein